MKYSTKIYQYLMIAVIPLIITGCNSIGPHQVRLDRHRYNDVIQDTNNEQLLTNIVRLRYVEPMTNLKLTNITSSYTLNPSISTAGTGLTSLRGSNTAPAGSGSSITKVLNIDPAIQYSDTPTITYTPVENAQFVKELMEPLALYKVHLFTYGGLADSSLLFRLIFQNIGDLDNASAASSERMRGLPEYKKYYKFAEKMTKFLDHGDADVRLKKINNHSAISIFFTPKANTSTEVNELKDMLGIKNKISNEIILSDADLGDDQNNVVYVRMRSVYGIMIYMSYGVQIPESDIEKHYVYSYHNADGTPYNWEPLTQGLLNVQSSETPPSDAFVKTKVHGHWFYIDNADLDSKTAFLLLNRLIALSSSSLDNLMGNGPALTLPAR